MKKLLKKIFLRMPLKSFFFKWLRMVWRPSENIYKHFYFRGRFKIDIEKGHHFQLMHYGYQVENEIFWEGLFGRWEKESMRVWVDLTKRSSVILDIGANTGLYSLVAKTMNPDSIVYAFEPIKATYDKLCKNCEINGYEIVTYNAAVSDINGPSNIYVEDGSIYTPSMNQNVTPGAEVKTYTVNSTTLDRFITENCITRIDLIKIDVELHEVQVMNGFREHLQLFKPTLLVEVLTDEIGEKIETILGPLGYLFFNINEQKGLKKVKNIQRSDHYNYLFCSPLIAEELGLVK